MTDMVFMVLRKFKIRQKARRQVAQIRTMLKIICAQALRATCFLLLMIV